MQQLEEFTVNNDKQSPSQLIMELYKEQLLISKDNSRKDFRSSKEKVTNSKQFSKL